jgi:hypothetical protein
LVDASTLLDGLGSPFVSAVAGLALAGVGWLVGASPSGGVKRQLTLARMPFNVPTTLLDGQEVKLRGRVAPGESLVTSPLTGRTGVIYLVTASLLEGGDVTLETASRDFWLDCGGDTRVFIRTKGAEFLGTPEWLLLDLHVAHVIGGQVLGRATPEQRQWALSRLAGETNLSHMVETLVQPGQELYAVGRVTLESRVPTLDGSAPGGLTLVARSESLVRETMAGRRALALALGGTGLLVTLGAVVWAVWVLAS